MTLVRPATRRTAAATIAALLLTGCVGTSTADPTLPPGTDIPTSTDTPTSAEPTDQPTTGPTVEPTPTATDSPAPTDDELVEVVDAYRNITLDLPALPIKRARRYVSDRVDELTTPDGTARGHLQGVPEGELIDRGTHYTTILGDPQPDGQDWTVTGCVASAGRTTFVTTGEETESDPYVGVYYEVGLRVTPADDGGWLLADFDVPDDPLDRVDCAPPDVVEAVQANWEKTNELFAAWTADGQSAERFEPLKPLLTADYYDTLSEMIGTGSINADPDIETEYGFEVLSVRPGTDVIARWCQDATRDPSARATDNETGEVTDISQQPPAIITAEWQHSDGGWRQGAQLGSIVAQEGEAPCDG